MNFKKKWVWYTVLAVLMFSSPSCSVVDVFYQDVHGSLGTRIGQPFLFYTDAYESFTFAFVVGFLLNILFIGLLFYYFDKVHKKQAYTFWYKVTLALPIFYIIASSWIGFKLTEIPVVGLIGLIGLPRAIFIESLPRFMIAPVGSSSPGMELLFPLDISYIFALLFYMTPLVIYVLCADVTKDIDLKK